MVTFKIKIAYALPILLKLKPEKIGYGNWLLRAAALHAFELKLKPEKIGYGNLGSHLIRQPQCRVLLKLKPEKIGYGNSDFCAFNAL